MKQIVYCIIITVALISCEGRNPNVNSAGTDELESHEITRELNSDEMAFHDEIYVPIYSDIYADIQNQNLLLAATLSIRNTSFTDSLFVSKIEYYHTDGGLVRRYINQTISLPPMATINYVIEKEDDAGGSGANFIVSLHARNLNIRPLIQAVMIGYSGNKAFSFCTDGYSILEKE